MSELETGPKIRFPLKERNNSSTNRNQSTFVTNKEVRQQKLQEFDEEISDFVDNDLLETFELGTKAYNQGLDSAAHKHYLKVVSSVCYNPEILFESYKNLGNILVRSGDLDGAEEFYNKAYTINPDSDTLLVNLGTLEMQKPNLERALERYRMAVEVNSSNPRAWIGLALVHREYGDHELSWGNLEKALDIDPIDQTALDLMVEWGVKESRFDTVLQRLESFLSLNPHNIQVAETYAKVLIVGGRLQKAQVFIEEYTKREGSYPGLTQLLEALLSAPVKMETPIAK